MPCPPSYCGGPSKDGYLRARSCTLPALMVWPPALSSRYRLWTIVSVLAATGLAVFGLLTPTTARAAQTWEVQAGLDRVGTKDGVSANQFGPQSLTINVGDTVAWTIVGFHTVTFPTGAPPQLPQPSLARGDIDFTVVVLPAGGSSYDGSQWLSSGVPQDPS